MDAQQLMETAVVGEFFIGWRRKCGVLTLAMALVFAGGWVRSFVVDDFIEFPLSDDSTSGLETQDQMLLLYWFSRAIPPDVESESESESIETMSSVSANNDILPAPTQTEFGDSTVAAAESEEWIVVGGPVTVRAHETVISCFFSSPEPLLKIPFWPIVIPLTLVSAWLLLWKPRLASKSASV